MLVVTIPPERSAIMKVVYWHMSRKRCTPDLSVGVGISVIEATLAGSGSTPLSVSLCPMKVTEGDLNCNFFADSQVMVAAFF